MTPDLREAYSRTVDSSVRNAYSLVSGKGSSLVLILYFTYILPMPQSEYLIPDQGIIHSI